MKKLALMMALLAAGCVTEGSADEVLAAEGLHGATYGVPDPFACHDDDHFSRTFDARRTVTEPDGRTREVPVSGVICCGFFTCAVRLD